MLGVQKPPAPPKSPFMTQAGVDGKKDFILRVATRAWKGCF